MSAKKPWLDEPDALDWVDDVSGYPCAIRRNTTGSLCGYVGVPHEHPLHGKPFNARVKPPPGWSDRSVRLGDVSIFSVFFEIFGEHGGDGLLEIAAMIPAHRGLSFSKAVIANATFDAPDPRADWWFGFDCGHSEDLSPGIVEAFRSLRRKPPWPPGFQTYRTIGYVRQICGSMAEALKAFAEATAPVGTGA